MNNEPRLYKDIRTTKHGKAIGFIKTQRDVTSDEHVVLRGNPGWVYLNKGELQELITNLQDLLEELE